jgi:hypothetical protein
MSPRRNNASGFVGVHARENGTFYAELRAGAQRITLGTFETAHEAARTYDAAAWRLGRLKSMMNFRDVESREETEFLAPPPRLITQEDNRRHRALQRQLYHAVEDERLRAELRQHFPEDIAATEAF